MQEFTARHRRTTAEPSLAEIKRIVSEKWPETLLVESDRQRMVFAAGIESFDRLFPSGGIPYGQLVEITGDLSGGKTGLLFRLLAGIVSRTRAAYVDIGNSFFPGAASAGGVDLDRLIVVKPRQMQAAMRTTELLLRHKMVGCVVVDLVGQSGILPIAWCHRLRTRTVRARGLVIFMTENNSQVIPPSMISLRLEVRRARINSVIVTVTKSRVSPEGARAEVVLYGT